MAELKDAAFEETAVKNVGDTTVSGDGQRAGPAETGDSDTADDLSFLFATNLMTVRTSSPGTDLLATLSSGFSILMALKKSERLCRELMVKEVYKPEWM